jgi:hypothetical protein
MGTSLNLDSLPFKHYHINDYQIRDSSVLILSYLCRMYNLLTSRDIERTGKTAKQQVHMYPDQTDRDYYTPLDHCWY